MQASEYISAIGASAKSLAKILLQSRKNKIGKAERKNPLVIMANGPSLRSAIDANLAQLRQATTMAVNFAANAPEFTKLQPDFYILADPHFFSSEPDANLDKLRSSLSQVDWLMTLLVPVGKENLLPESVIKNPDITVDTFNMVGIEGYAWLENLAFKKKWGMPRPRNVLVPAIACGIWLGFEEIYILGADHSWIKNLEVDSQNHVISVQPHFYKESDREQKRVDTVYRGVHLHQVVESFAIALKSYHQMRRLAETRGVKIYNATPGSFIDAFERSPWPRTKSLSHNIC